jgi:DNA-binding NtrC family response regulator
VPYPVLIVDDEVTFARNIATFLTRNGYEVSRVESAEEGLEQINAFRPAVVLLDFNLPGMDGLQMLAEIRRRDRRIKVILVTGQGSEQVAVDAMKAGAHDYLTKPVVLGKLKLVLEKASGQERLEDELNYYRARESSGSGLANIVGESGPILALKGEIRHVVAADVSLIDADPPAVLITGETGAGKELVARALHFEGPRRDRPFLEFNCANLPLHLVEAELFGYERGAFTDAKERKQGLIETAEGGTLFLDEIGDIEPSLQVKLLKLIENKMVRRLGSVREQKANVRIVTATNKPLERMVREGTFRSDLFYRLRIVHLRVPPLRERGEDILRLARHFLALHGARYRKPDLAYTSEACERLRAYDWPGNVRELKNLLEQCVIMARGGRVDAEHLNLPLGDKAADPAVPGAAAGDARDPLNLSQVERDLVERALRESGWNITQAAKLLGVTRDTLRYRIEKLGFTRP